MNLSERQLRLFVTTAALGNISRASEALHISQPALTRAIAVFEGQMGAPLFVRTTRRVVLTPEGEAFLPTAKRLLEDLAEAGRMFSPQGLGIKGQVTVAVGSSFGSIVLPGAIAAFQAAYPGVRLRVVDDNSEGIARKVRLADVDLGIGSAVGDVDALACRRLLTAPLGLLAPPGHFDITDADAQGVPRLPLLRESADTSIMQLLRMHGSALLAPSLRWPRPVWAWPYCRRWAHRTRWRAACALCRCSRRWSASCSSCAAATGRRAWRHARLKTPWCATCRRRRCGPR